MHTWRFESLKSSIALYVANSFSGIASASRGISYQTRSVQRSGAAQSAFPIPDYLALHLGTEEEQKLATNLYKNQVIVLFFA